jgi:Cu(I)/Ag(I) efflux system membrane fusion protein
VIDTGERKIVFVVHENRHFEPREVKLGLQAGAYYEVVDGVKEGELVVTSAQFLIDSESRLKAALKGLSQAEEEKMPEAKKSPAKEKKETPIKHIH